MPWIEEAEGLGDGRMEGGKEGRMEGRKEKYRARFLATESWKNRGILEKQVRGMIHDKGRRRMEGLKDNTMEGRREEETEEGSRLQRAGKI